MENKEIWKDIPGYEGLYQLSNQRRFRRLETIGKNGRILRPKILKVINNHGYKVIYLTKNGESKIKYLEQIYYELFEKGKFYDKETNTYVS